MIRPMISNTMLLPFVLVLACSGKDEGASGEQLNIGETTVLGASLSDYAAKWEGYAELHEFGSGEGDGITLELDENGDGHLRVGTHALYEPATDALERWPTEDWLPQFNVIPAGFLHTFSGAQVTSQRLQLRVPVQPMDSWCALQTPYEQEGASGYNCFPNYPFTMIDGACYTQPEAETLVPISCVQMEGCGLNRACSCDEGGCVGATKFVGLDAVLEDDGQTLKGTLSDSARVTIVLHRVE